MFKACGCGATYTKAQWEALPLLSDGLDPESAYVGIEMRNCAACDSTLGVELPVADVDTCETRAALGGEGAPDDCSACTKEIENKRLGWRRFG